MSKGSAKDLTQNHVMRANASPKIDNDPITSIK